MKHPTPHATIQTLHGVIADTTASMERGPLVDQPVPAARLARILSNAAQELWDACTLQDAAQMWEDARAIASRILAACPKG